MEFLFPQFCGSLLLNAAGLQSQILLSLLLMPNLQAGESDMQLRTFTPVGEPL